jgi:hypothetical protein
MLLLWPPAAAQLHIDAPQLRRTPLDFSQATLNWPASGVRLQSFIPGPDMDRPWMRRKPLPCTSPATPRPVRTGPTGMPDRARTSLKGVLAVSLCQLVQLLLTFRSCHSTCLTASHSLLGLLSMPGALHKASQTWLRLHSEVWSQAPIPILFVTLASTAEVPPPKLPQCVRSGVPPTEQRSPC